MTERIHPKVILDKVIEETALHGISIEVYESKQTDYRIEIVGYYLEDLMPILNALEKEGWKATSIEVDTHITHQGSKFILKIWV